MRNKKRHRQGQARFRCLIEIIRHHGLFKPLKADDARSIFITATSPKTIWTPFTIEEFSAYLDTL